MKMSRGIAVAITAALLASGGGTATALITAKPAEASSTQPEINSAVQQILTATNAERTKVGLAPLTLAPSLSTVAQKWTQTMAANHTMVHNPYYQFELPQPWQRVGENVGQGYTTSTIVPAWMASEGHRANILGTFTHIGIGYYVDETGRGWFTQNFGYYDVPQLTETNEPTNTVSPFGFSSSWLAKPEENVSGYKVELYSPSGQLLKTENVTTPNVSFSGLNELTSYVVKVNSTAVDVPGIAYSSPVKTFTVTTYEQPPSVSIPTLNPVFPEAKQASVSWLTPQSIVGKLVDYTLTVKQDGQPDRVMNTPYNSYLVTGLNENTTYRFELKANAVSLSENTMFHPCQHL